MKVSGPIPVGLATLALALAISLCHGMVKELC